MLTCELCSYIRTDVERRWHLERHGKPRTQATSWAASSERILAISAGILAIACATFLFLVIFPADFGAGQGPCCSLAKRALRNA